MIAPGTAHALITGATVSTPRTWKRLDYLDSLRAVAVFVVFIVHVTEVFIRVTAKQKGIYQIGYDLNLGRVGVVTFFAISGFLIPSSLHGPTGLGLRRFAVTRVCRLYPAYLVSLVPSIATYTIMTQGDHITLHQSMLNLTMVPSLFGAPMANGAYWTLGVELTFYIMCALLFYGGVLRNTFVLAALMFGAFVVFYSSQAQIWGGLLNPALSSDTFSFGLIFPACFGGPLSVAGGTATALTLTTAMMAVVTFYWLAWMPSAYALDRLGLVHRSLDSRLIAGYSIGLWLFVLGLFVIRIRARIISWFGRISYSFYLTHQAGLYLPFWLTLRYPPLQNHPMIYYLLVATVTSTLLAAASYYLVERRFIRLGHRLTRRPDLSERSII